MRKIAGALFVLLAGCVETGGDPCGYPSANPILNAQYQSCVAARETELARARGATVQTCYPAGGGAMTCVTE